MKTLFIRTNSHRARDKVTTALGRKPVSFFSFFESGSFQQVTEAELPKLAGIKGVTKARFKFPEKIMECIRWD